MSDLELDSLVELLDQYSNAYPNSPTGARGWIRGKRLMSSFDPQVWISWDKDHWRYQGERDGWAYEHHFRPVTDFAPEPNKFDIQELLSTAQEHVESEVDGPQPCPFCGEIHEDQEDYLNVLMEAQEAALGADGFFILTLAPQVYDNRVVYEPEMFSEYMTTTAQEMLETQIIHLAFQLIERDMLRRMKTIQEGFPPDAQD